MNESELSNALRGAATAGSPPLALDAQGMLSHAKRSRSRHRATLAAAASVVAVVAVAGATALTGNLAFGGNGVQAGGPGGAAPCAGNAEGTAVPAPQQSGPAVQTGGPGAPIAVTPTGTAPTATPTSWPTSTILPTPTSTVSPPRPCPTENTETPWPSGQTDRTATAGPHHERAVALQSTLAASLPPGAQLVRPYPQGQIDDYVGTVEVWEYSVYGGVALPGHGTAWVNLDVFTPRPGDHTNLCALEAYPTNPAPHCTVRTVNGQKIAVATAAGGSKYTGETSWVVYRAPDGTVVHLGQGRHDNETPLPATADIFTVDRMIELVLSGRFTS
jgi:hypothetical protein